MSDSDISRAIDAGAVTLEQLRDRLNVTTGCGHCSVYIEEHLEMKLEQALNHLEPQSA